MQKQSKREHKLHNPGFDLVEMMFFLFGFIAVGHFLHRRQMKMCFFSIRKFPSLP